MLCAIPNRVYVHNDVKSIKTFLGTFYLLNLLYFFPMMAFPMIVYFWIIVESEIIGTIYKKSRTFRRTIVMYMFNGDHILCELYVYKLWGNPSLSGGHGRLLAFATMCLESLVRYCARQKLGSDISF